MAKSGKKKSEKSGDERLGKAAFLEQLAPLELELNDMARWLQHTGQRVLVLVEGRDTAGKGGVISAIADTLSPRQCRTCRRPARSCSSTAAGTTAPASNA